MNIVASHISYLLLSCRKVSLPGIGNFKASCQHAYFDAENGIFYPSRFRIKFDNSSKCEYSSLSGSLQRRLNISSAECKVMIDEFVNYIISRLSKSKYCRLEGIGYLLINAKGETLFLDTFSKASKQFLMKPVRV